MPKGEKICTFKRGLKFTDVFSLNFNLSSTHLALSASSGTIHVFEIEEAKNGRQSLIINEIPYQLNKSSLIEKIANLVKEKKIVGI